LSELAAFLGVSVGGTIPAIRFFGPRPRFIQYMAANYRGRLLFEIGAGAGHVARALADLGLTITALDLYHQDFEEFPITIADATVYKYPPESVIMFCRPSHEGFVEKAIERALKCGVTEILYVGLPANRRQDLGGYNARFRRILTDVGRKRENVYRMCRKDSTADFTHSSAEVKLRASR